MKKLLIILFIISSFNSKGTIHTIGVWGGYYEFVPASITIQLGDTLQWEPYFGLLPMMLHTITSDNIPVGAASFDQVWQMPSDTFFQYIPQVAGLYQYVCTPHIPNGMIGEFTVTNGSNTQTYVPDDNFESYLEANGMGNGIANDDYVITSAIDTVIILNIENQNISDFTGIEDFANLTYLNCGLNQLTSLDVTQNTALTFLNCSYNQLTSLDLSTNITLEALLCNNNQLTSLDLRNGNNTNLSYYVFSSTDNPNLNCIDVDDAYWSTANWTIVNNNIDQQQYFSANCYPSAIKEHTTTKELLKVTDLLGRETKGTKNEPLLYIYDDGAIEKRINIE
jgi:plastocyanin